MSSADVPEQDRVAFVRKIYGRTIAELEIEPHADSPFVWRGALRELPNLGLVAGACSAIRTTRRPGPSDSDDLILNVMVEGRLVLRQPGRAAVVGPGEIAVTRRRDAVESDCDPHSRFVDLRVPFHALAPTIVDLQSILASPISAPEPLSMLLRYVDVLLDSGGLDQPETIKLAVAHVHEIVGLILGANRRAADGEKARGPGAVRLQAIKADIIENACSRDLSIVAVARRHQVTPRYVRKLFEAEGVTFSEFVLNQRLGRAQSMLTDPRRSEETISAIAFACGFGDLSYFNRVFRRQTGGTPTAVREAASRQEITRPRP
jgi:AraC-like DNA-binding protein